MSILLKYYQDKQEMMYHRERLVNEIAFLERTDEDTSDLDECLMLTDDKIRYMDEKHQKWLDEEMDIICEMMLKTLNN